MAPNIGFATLSIIPSASGMGAAMASQVKGPAAAAGTTAGTVMGTAMKGAMAGALVGIGAIAGLAKLGGSFDEAFDTIRVGTGATGEALEGLQGSFKNVFGSIPTDMTSASTAIADLNTRLGLTGGNLEATATQILELSRITGSDLTSNIESITRVFGDWGITVDDQGERMDQLFRASQATGIATDTLSQQMVKFGAPMRQLGFDFETTAGLLGKFEKEGVNAELVMGSMRIALGKMARDGEPAEETLQRVTEQIANAGSASEANALALELFGARAGPDMAAAIREGRFELGDLYGVIADGQETILGAAEDTNDWKESWEVLRNQGFVLLEPIATRVFDMLAVGMDYLAEKAPIVAAWFGENMWPGVKTIGEFIGGAVSTGFAALSSWWADYGETVTGGLKAIGDTIGSAVSAGFEALSNWWTTNGDTVLGGIRGIGDIINDPVIPALESLRDWIRDEILPKFVALFDYIKENEFVLRVVLVTAIGAVALAFGAWAFNAGLAAGATALAMGSAILAWLPFVLVGLAVAALAAYLWTSYENGGWFMDVVAGLVIWVGWLSDKVETLVGWLQDAWRWFKKLENVKIPIPGGGTVGVSGNNLWDAFMASMPFFDAGGIVPGARGEPQLILAHGGETVLPTHKQDFSLSARRYGDGNRTVNQYFVSQPDAGSSAAAVAWELAR